MANNQVAKLSRITTAGKVVIGVLAAVTSIIGIYIFFFPKEESIVATGIYSDFLLPSENQKELNDHVLKVMQEIGRIAGASHGTISMETLDGIGNLDKSMSETIMKVGNFSNLVKINIKNEGYKQAENISIELPNSGVYIIHEDGKDLSTSFSNSIPLGTLRPSMSRTVYIWTSGSLAFDPPMVTYTNGSIPVFFKQNISTGWHNYLPSVGIGFLLGAIFIIVSMFVTGDLGIRYIANPQGGQSEPTAMSSEDIDAT